MRARFAAAYAVVALVAAGAPAATAVVLTRDDAPRAISADAVVAAFRAERIELEPAGGTAAGTVFLREAPRRDGRIGLFVIVAAPRSGVARVLAGAPLPASTGVVRFSELEVANVTVRSARWGPDPSGDAAVRAAVARLR